MRSLKDWLDQPVISRVGRAERREVPGLVAYHTEGAAPCPDTVCNISATGMYLLTSTRWPIGSPVDMTLQRQGQPEESAENRIVLRARPVRFGMDGVGLSFVHTTGTVVHLWENRNRDTNDPIEPVDIVREFRVARAEAFIQRICPSAGTQTSRMLRSSLGSFRTESAIEIALKAESHLDSDTGKSTMQVHPEVLKLILENGSWAEIDWTRELWANLLMSSCKLPGSDRENLNLIQLLSELNVNQARILTMVCGRSARSMAETGSPTLEPVVCSVEQLKRTTGVGDMVRVDRDVQHLAELGLLTKRSRANYFSDTDDFTLLPTALGMDLYTRSTGQNMGSLEAFRMATLASQVSTSVQ